MVYTVQQAPAGLDTEGVRKFTEEQLREIGRATSEMAQATAGLGSSLTTLTGRVTALEGRATALEARATALETWKTSIDTLPVLRVALATQHAVTASVYAKVLFDLVDFDSGSGWSVANKRYVAPRAGYYSFTWSFYGANSTSMTRFISGIQKNGTNYTLGADFATTNSIGISAGSSLVFLNGSTDYIEGVVYCTATTPIVGATSNAYLTTLAGQWVRP